MTNGKANKLHSEIVKPIHLDLYLEKLNEAKKYSYPGYIDEVVTLLKARNEEVTRGQVENVTKAVKKSWPILNAILATVGLPEVTDMQTPGEKEISKSLKLQKAS